MQHIGIHYHINVAILEYGVKNSAPQKKKSQARGHEQLIRINRARSPLVLTNKARAFFSQNGFCFRHVWGVPGNAGECPGNARECLGMTRNARKLLEMPGNAEECPGMAGNAGACPGMPGNARECPGTLPNAKECPGMP